MVCAHLHLISNYQQVDFDLLLCVQRVKEVYKQYKDLENGPSIQCYMQYEAKEIDLSCYCETRKIDVSTYCETIKWQVVDYSKPPQV